MNCSAKKKFKLNGKPKCAAAFAAKSGDIIIVPNAQAANLDPGHSFKFCDPKQESYLKSLIILPIKDDLESEYHRHIVCIDTDEEGFFNDSMKPQYEFIQEQLKMRLLIELGFEQMLEGNNKIKAVDHESN